MSARSKLDRRQEAAIAALLSESTHALAAERAGISEATLQRWLRLESFQQAYRQARHAIVEEAVKDLQCAAKKAVAALVQLLTCGHNPTVARAALGLVEHSFKTRETDDLAERVAKLEKILSERNERHELGNAG